MEKKKIGVHRLHPFLFFAEAFFFLTNIGAALRLASTIDLIVNTHICDVHRRSLHLKGRSLVQTAGSSHQVFNV